MPIQVTTDPVHGGRWTSLRAGDREWLWANPDAATTARRRLASPDSEFVDAGGAEECFPTVRGNPDHGAAWCRAWRSADEFDSVDLPGAQTLRRRLRDGRRVVVDYTVSGPPGTAFLHAVHALLAVGPDAQLILPGDPTATILDDPGPPRPWPSGLDRLGPDDGTAVCVLLPGCHRALVVDGNRALRLSWTSSTDRGQCSLLFWRNLRGWPAGAPYRSIGIEPMVGRAADRGQASPAELAQIPASGSFEWQLTITALTRG